MGGKARVIAAAEIGKYFPESKLISNSHSRDSEKPTHAAVIAEELQSAGIPAERIVQEEESIDTYSEIAELLKMIEANKWKNISVVTSDYHIPRAEKLYEHLAEISQQDSDIIAALQYCKDNEIKINFIAAETILPFRSKRYESIITQAKETEEYKKRVEFEAEGVDRIEKGLYQVDLHKPEDKEPR
ncbi:MAG: YdcF family protein [Patescibacteria group bacterium]